MSWNDRLIADKAMEHMNSEDAADDGGGTEKDGEGGEEGPPAKKLKVDPDGYSWNRSNVAERPRPGLEAAVVIH